MADLTSAVTDPSRLRLPRAIGVLVLLAAWLVLSNHCAVAVLEHGSTAQVAVHSCCPEKAPEGRGHAPEGDAGMCCKGLRVLPQDAPVKMAKAQDSVLLFELAWSAVLDLPAGDAEGAGDAGAAPPREVRSFAERVLPRSLRSHAPPSVA